MNNRERTLAILSYKEYDRMPIVDFGFIWQPLEKWHEQGHITLDELNDFGDGSPGCVSIEHKLGFDFNWQGCFNPGIKTGLMPPFERRVIEIFPDGREHIVTHNGTIEGIKPGIHCIPQDIGTLLTDRTAWEEQFLPKLQFSQKRIEDLINLMNTRGRFSCVKIHNTREPSPCVPREPSPCVPELYENPRGLHCGSLYGSIRNMMGVAHLAYLQADDEDLYHEIIDVIGDLSYQTVKAALGTGINFDFAHFWEDICFKNGPLVNPTVFKERVGPHYKKITDLLHKHGIQFVSLDCDGLIDHLVPTWLENGVNVMFPLEVGTWGANIHDLRKKFGKGLLAVGGMDKRLFTAPDGYKAIDMEVDRLRRLVDLGGYIPCPDHRIPDGAIWENIQYYCERMKEVFW